MLRTLETPRGAVFVLSAYFLLLLAIKLSLFTGLSNDDSEQLLYSQSLELVYDVSNPPLYTWLLVALQQVLPPSALSVSLLKFALLGGCYLLLYLTGREAGYDHRLSLTFAVSLLTLYHVVWEAVRHFSHSVLLAFCVVFTVYALVRLARRGGALDYGLLALALVLGCFAKYNYFFFMAALLVAACAVPRYRPIIASRWMLGALLVVILFLLPYGLAMQEQLDQALATAARKLQPGDGAAWAGLSDLATSFIGFQLPFLLLFALIFYRSFKRDPASGVAHGELARLLLYLNAVLLCELAALTLLSGTSRVKNHLFFITCLLPAGLLAWSFGRRLDERAIRRFWGVALVLALLVPVVLLAKLFGDARAGKKAYFNVPYRELAAAIRDLSMQRGLVFTGDAPYPLSGNLRVHLPELRVATSKFAYQPPREDAGACLILWESRRQPHVGDTTIARAYRRFGIDESAAYRAGSWRMAMAYQQAETLEFSYRYFPRGAGECR